MDGMLRRESLGAHAARSLKICLTAGLVTLGLSSSVFAQLRTGRSTRSTYVPMSQQELAANKQRSEVATEEVSKAKPTLPVNTSTKKAVSSPSVERSGGTRISVSKGSSSKATNGKTASRKVSAKSAVQPAGHFDEDHAHQDPMPQDVAPGEQSKTSSGHEGSAAHGTAEHGASEHGAAEHGASEHGAAEHGAAEHGASEHGAAIEHHGVEHTHMPHEGCATCQRNALAADHVVDENWYGDDYGFVTHGSGAYGVGYHGHSSSTSLLGRMIYGLHFRAEASRWDRSGQSLPILVTTSPSATPAANAGQLGLSTTSILFGGSDVNGTSNTGGRLTVGTWLDDCESWGLVFRGWDAGALSTEFSAANTQFPIIARPFLNVTSTPEQDTQLIAYPGTSTGNINVKVDSEIAGADLSLKRLIYVTPHSRWEMLYGLQFISLNESLDIRSNTQIVDPQDIRFPAGFALTDSFSTQNQFRGFQVGLQGSKQYGCWYYEGMLRFGLGSMERTVTINGQNSISSNGSTTTEAQGLLARFSNSGSFASDTFVVVPEAGLLVGYSLTKNIDLTLGYTAMMLPKVAQAASQVDRDLASNLSNPLSGALRPSFVLNESNYWLSGLNFGAQWRY
jgi:hypothetical protein